MDIRRPFGKNFVKLFEKIFSSLTNGHEEVVLAEVAKNFSHYTEISKPFWTPYLQKNILFITTEKRKVFCRGRFSKFI